MVFNSRKVKQTFRIGDEVIQHTDRICYLGFILTPSGKFRATVKYLYDKANRAFFVLTSKYKLLPNLSVETQLK